jgi:glucosylglycerol-phosphate synthase
MSDPSIVMVYHRAPFDEDVLGDLTRRREHSSPNGIIPTLRGVFAQGRAGMWVAWTRADAARAAPFAHDMAVECDGIRIVVHRVPLTAAVVERFYHRFSKESLWPVLCSSPTNAQFDAEQWETFVDVNARFADAVAAVAEPEVPIWIHDYNLWLVPGLLRTRMPQARIGFFQHTPFPAADIFAILPWRDEIIRSLLACDLVAFHLPHYANNFAAAAGNLVGARVMRQGPAPAALLTTGTPLSAPTMVHELEHDDRRVRLRAVPAAIDSARIDAIRASPAHARRVSAIRAQLPGRRILLSIERLDYVKGPVEKLLAFERLLEQHAGYHEKLTFAAILAPAPAAICAQHAVRADVDRVVERINRRFATPSWAPVHYLPTALGFEHVVSWYEVADVAWISPLRDGLNLVAKEFVAASDGADKMLIVSEFAGAHVELRHTITVNPYAPASMQTALLEALEMGSAERRWRMLEMNRIVRARTPHDWGSELLAELEPDPDAVSGGPVTRRPPAIASSGRSQAPSGSS